MAQAKRSRPDHDGTHRLAFERKGGLGEGFDLLVIDEAQEYTNDQESALKYVVTDSRNPQTLFCGTPPTPVSSGTVFLKLRNAALQGETENTGWAEKTQTGTDAFHAPIYTETAVEVENVLVQPVSADDVISDLQLYDYINLGNYVLIQSDPHGINQYVELTSMKIDLLDPANDTLTFGADTASLTDSQRSSERSVQAALESTATRITNLVATAITTEYLSANYATITELDAVTARIDNITSTTITTEYLEANYATINSLTAEVANINSVLAGNVGAGTIQTVHLTSENVVIDDAVITDAMIVNLTASKITAGTIYTSLVTIQSESGNLYITDNTIQIQDDNTTVRVQIGEDASGDYNLYLWDASGNLLWDAGGLYAAGIHDGIIKDIAVAEDAAISGTKLDIASVAECLNADGSLTVNAAQVTIDDSTLSVWYTTVNTKTDELEEATSTLQTGLEVVQGQITAKVWQSDIDEAVSDISVGGRNYLLNTRTFDGWSRAGNVTLEEDDEGYTVATWAATTTLAYNGVSSWDPIQFSLVRGQTVTLSFDIRSDDFDSSDTSSSNKVVVSLALCTADSTAKSLYRDTILSHASMSYGGSLAANRRVEKLQLPLFALAPQYIHIQSAYWLQDVVSASTFAFVNYYGVANNNAANTNTLGVRPYFLIS